MSRAVFAWPCVQCGQLEGGRPSPRSTSGALSWLGGSRFGMSLRHHGADWITKTRGSLPVFDNAELRTVARQSSSSRDLRNALIHIAAFSGFSGLHLSSQAWAVDVAQAQQNVAGIVGSIDELKNGFTLAFLLIFFSELGDKTFFIAALLAARKSSVPVFVGTFGALVTMTLISVTLGRAFHYIDGALPFSIGDTELPLDDLAAVALLVYFGVSTLLDAASMEGSKSQEEQQEAELAIAGVNGGGAIGGVVATTFALVFVAEWGDKSFFSTIALAAASSPTGVVAGAIAGHGVATLLAVLGGSLLGNYISEKATAYIGGSLFLLFAADTLYNVVTGHK